MENERGASDNETKETNDVREFPSRVQNQDSAPVVQQITSLLTRTTIGTNNGIFRYPTNPKQLEDSRNKQLKQSDDSAASRETGRI